MEEEKKVAGCPHCQTRYRLPVHLENKTVSCKKCGKTFVIKFNGPPAPSSAKNEASASNQAEGEQVLGKLALKFKIITQDQYQDAIARQKQLADQGEEVLLETIMVHQNMISSDQLDYLRKVKEMREVRTLDREFGNLAIEKGWAGEAQVTGALEEQARIFTRSKTITRIGDILVDNGAMAEDRKQELLVKQGRVSSSEFSRLDMDDGGDPGVEFDVLISDDRLTAFILPKDEVPPTTTPMHIRNVLSNNGIKYGILSDKLIQDYLDNKAYHRSPWKVAQAMAPTPPREPEIKYYFNTDPFRIGKIKEGGVIDFRDRGAVPQVQEGDLLAEKIPGIEGTAGVDLLGKPIPSAKPRPLHLQCGPGTKRDHTGMKVFATKNGRPERTSSGVFHVFPEHQVKGDVDFHTGHVIFDGHVIVRGSIKEGFQVKSGSLVAREINKAEVETENDVGVMEGVIGAHIRAGGNVRAKYVSGSTIEARGDVVIENEIRNSRIEATGTVILTSGSIFGSEICAKGMIEAQNIGSHAAAPSTLIIGIDFGLNRQIELLKERVKEIEENKEKLNRKILEINQKTTRFIRRMKELNEVWDVAAEQKYDLERRLAFEQDAGDTEGAEKTDKKLSHIQSLMDESQRYLEDVADKQETLINQIVKCREEIAESDVEVEAIHHEIDQLVDSMKLEEDKSFVRVRGLLAGGTLIKGRHASLRIEENIDQAFCREGKLKDDQGAYRWVMDVSHVF